MDLHLRGVPAGKRDQEVRPWHCGWNVGDDQRQLHGGSGLRGHMLPLLPCLPEGTSRELPES
uniref:Uncharacterized protein n=1 Tax=Arundo donax TaxID=35708 RepID=A0A0A8ZIN1_ARUDO